MSTQTAKKEAREQKPILAAVEGSSDAPNLDSSTLVKYIALLVLDSERLGEFLGVIDLQDKYDLLLAEGLNQVEIELLTTGCFEKLCRYIKVPWPAPTGGDQTGGKP